MKMNSVHINFVVDHFQWSETPRSLVLHDINIGIKHIGSSNKAYPNNLIRSSSK